MKAKIIHLLILTSFLSVYSYGQTAEPTTYYVTIGVFAVHNNAIRYTDKANKNNFSAQYAIHPVKKWYYVYLLTTTDRKKAFAFCIKMRVETEYKDCWVYMGRLGEEQPIVEKVTEKVPEKVILPEKKPTEIMIEEVKKDSVVTPPVVKIDSSTLKKPEVKKLVVPHVGKGFYFKLINAETGQEIKGEVHVQESAKASQYQAFHANEIVYIKPPVNSEGTYSVLTNAPGYEQIKTTITYKEPEGTKGAEDEFIIPLTLKKAKSGDYIDFNNVKFVRNAAIMTAGSEDELGGLAALMKENSKYRIKIHGHCNGKQTREIIVLGKSQNFFGMDPKNNIKETRSAKVLSEERAKTVRAYLVSQGIDESRIAIKAEGGRIPLYPETGSLGPLNDRVEIEIKKD